MDPLQAEVSLAQTALLVPFRWSERGVAVGARRERLLALRRGGPAGRPTWKAVDAPTRPVLGGEPVKELDPVLQRLLGRGARWDGPAESRVAAWLALREDLANDWSERLRLNEHVRKKGPEARFAHPRLRDAVVALFPEDVGVLVFRFDWPAAGPGGGPLLVADLARSLDRMRHLHKPYGFGAWRLAGVEGQPADQPPPAGGSHGDAKGLSFQHLANWLLGARSRKPGVVVPEVNHVLHHTAAVLDEPPEGAALERIAFHLRRAYGPDYVPPPDPGADRLLRVRGNRLVAVSREGSVALGWPDPSSDWETRADKGPARWTGIYLLLAVYVLAERATLSGLSVDAAELMRRAEGALSGVEAGDRRQTEQTERLRADLRALVARMVGYSLTTTLEDPGGMSEYAAFFDALRAVHRVPRRREELRGEVRELLEVIELFHDAAMERMERAEAEHRRRADEHRRFLEDTVAPVAAGVAALSVFSGLAGMNFERGMPRWPFWPATLLAVGASVGVGLLVAAWRADRLPLDVLDAAGWRRVARAAAGLLLVAGLAGIVLADVSGATRVLLACWGLAVAGFVAVLACRRWRCGSPPTGR